MKNTISVLLLIVIFASCNNSNKNNKIKSALWLLGKWENNSTDGKLDETWQKINDSTIHAQSYYIKAKDTVHFETITLQQKGEELIYNTTVKGQNNDEAVAFILTNATEKQLVFENANNDYPKRISYFKISKNSLKVEISGLHQGKPQAENYLMTKKE